MVEAKGLANFLQEVNETPFIEAECDASAALAVASRLGPGKLKHIDLRQLWIQQEIKSGTIAVVKTPSAENCADVLTKFMKDTTLFHKLVACLGINLPESDEKKVTGMSSSSGGFDKETYLKAISLLACAAGAKGQLTTATTSYNQYHDQSGPDEEFYPFVVKLIIMLMVMGTVFAGRIVARRFFSKKPVRDQGTQTTTTTETVERRRDGVRAFGSIVIAPTGGVWHLRSSCSGLTAARRVEHRRPCKVCVPDTGVVID